MVTTVCLNPAVDKNADVEQLQIGKVHRLGNPRITLGGKGINVAVVLGKLHADVGCVSFVGEGDIPLFVQSMEKDEVRFYAIQVPGNVRRNLKIVDGKTRIVTEFNEQGPEADAEAFDQLMRTLVRLAKTSRYVALCGSLPPGLAPDTYQTIMRRLNGKPLIVDTSGPALRYAVQEKPFLIKPNLTELEELTQTALPTPEAVKNAAVALCEAGIAHVAVSLGERGAILTNGKRTVFAPAIPVAAASTVGAGDSMLAGILYGLERGETAFEALRYGVAAGSACVKGGSVHAFSVQDFQTLLQRAEVREI